VAVGMLCLQCGSAKALRRLDAPGLSLLHSTIDLLIEAMQVTWARGRDFTCGYLSLSFFA